METPLAISWRTPPISFQSGRFFCLASASQIAASRAPLAMLWPRTQLSIGQTSEASVNSLPRSKGQRKSRRICHAVSIVSGLYAGVSPATHSPQPATPSTSASTSTIRRVSVRSTLVSKGVTSFMRISRSVIYCKRMAGLEVAPRRQYVRGPGSIFANGHGRVAAGEPVCKFGSDLSLQILELSGGFPLPSVEFARQGDRRGSSFLVQRFLRRRARQRREHMRGVQEPLRHQAVRGQSAMQRAAGHPIKIGKIAPGNRAEPVHIEAGIARLERVEGPLNQPNSPAQRLFALKELQAAADAAIAVGRQHSRHVGMQVRSGVAQRRESQSVTDKTRTIERAQHLAAGLRGDHKQGYWLDLQVSLSPNLPLQIDAGVELLERLALANDHFRRHGRGRAHRWFAADTG